MSGSRPSDSALGAPAGRPIWQASPATLHPSHWGRQVINAAHAYLAVGDDDILHGFRRAAGVADPPGQPLGGWSSPDSAMVFGQWLSGMSRLGRALAGATPGNGLDDRTAPGEPADSATTELSAAAELGTALLAKATRLFDGWAATVGPDGDARMPTYTFDKLVGGLVDLADPDTGGAHPAALDVLRRVVDHAMQTFPTDVVAPSPDVDRDAAAYQGSPLEWYTLGEHLLRAHRATGDARYLADAQRWYFPEYWRRFDETSDPPDAYGGHAYSHVNTFVSALAAYEVSGDEALLRQARHAAEFFLRRQCYATGGYGPNERIVASDGTLGRALETRSDTCEIGCCTWAAFKLAGGLLRHTGEACWGDWIERLVYNTIGAALPFQPDGRNFYYGDYRVGGAMKVYNWERFTCCSGTYLQGLAEYHHLTVLAGDGGVMVNLYLPSSTVVEHGGVGVRIGVATGYPDSEGVAISVDPETPARFAVRLRVPAWASGVTASLRGAASGEALPLFAAGGVPSAERDAGTPPDRDPSEEIARGADATVDHADGWLVIERTWRPGDIVDLRLPLCFRTEAVDDFHPDRVAVLRGPVVMVAEGTYHDCRLQLPADDVLDEAMLPEPAGRPRGVHGEWIPDPDLPTVFGLHPPGQAAARLRFVPFYAVGEAYPYFMYFDRNRPALAWW